MKVPDTFGYALDTHKYTHTRAYCLDYPHFCGEEQRPTHMVDHRRLASAFLR